MAEKGWFAWLGCFPPMEVQNFHFHVYIVMSPFISCPYYHAHINPCHIIMSTSNHVQKSPKVKLSIVSVIAHQLLRAYHQIIHGLDRTSYFEQAFSKFMTMTTNHWLVHTFSTYIQYTHILTSSRCSPTWSGRGGGCPTGVGRWLWSKGLFSWLVSDGDANTFVILVIFPPQTQFLTKYFSAEILILVTNKENLMQALIQLQICTCWWQVLNQGQILYCFCTALPIEQTDYWPCPRKSQIHEGMHCW